ncbi:glucose-6-phosphate isomerase [Thalassobius sp. I31.1]|uniref:glucose-6-phosphate isomerase n=1 Tax=Thalassobius sp. I31.1 TaxID=2109912 RepID=UPI002570A7EC|nr:glucose-6-phosphate isomerase [Thalassobius sp. I31.1]
MADNIMWNKLKTYTDAALGLSIPALFEDAGRGQDFSVRATDMLFDYSKTSLTDDSRACLIEMLGESGFEARRKAMFSGEHINETEDRAVLHTALRAAVGAEIFEDGENVVPGVRETLDRMRAFSDALRDGSFQGQGGAITDVVNIGIGGSDLGPAMACLALKPYHDGPRTHFVSNVDGAHIHDVLQGLNPETTLILVASKTFTTIETMTNAQTARDWMALSVSDPGAQFAALSSNLTSTAEWGIPAERVFGFEDWVGGRYSLWGPIGLTIMIAMGADKFEEFLSGARAMDDHFRTAEPLDNMPVMLALTGIWHNQGLGYGTRAVLPYDQRLSRLPAYLQQLEMESNGKSVRMDGSDTPVHTGAVVWGEPGTNGQHAFYQLIHQGTRVIPCEFLLAVEGHETDLKHQHELLVANCLAQSEALMLGRSLDVARELMAAKGLDGDELERQARHRVFPGNRPSTTLLYPKLTPHMLGKIIALYEHRVFVEGVMLGINSYDQWGVELGKQLAVALQPIVSGEMPADDKDGSTRQLVDFVRGS